MPKPPSVGDPNCRPTTYHCNYRVSPMKYLHNVKPGVYYLDHRLTPEVSGMLCAMASRMPLGGIEARYREIVEAVAEGIHVAECGDLFAERPDETWDAYLQRADGIWNPPDDPRFTRPLHERRGEAIGGARAWVSQMRNRAEDRLCEYPLPERVQVFFDRFVKNYGHSSILELC